MTATYTFDVFASLDVNATHGPPGDEPIFVGAGDYDLDLLESRTFDGRIQELVYRPTRRTWPAG